MPIFTYVARVNDGMLLVASLQPQAGNDRMSKYKQQAKMILKRLSTLSSLPTEMSIESGEFVFHYVIADGVCFLVLVKRSYPARVAFSYLREIQRGFEAELTKEHGVEWRQQVDTASRPYAFIKFDKFISQRLKDYKNPDSSASMSALTGQLSEVHSIMRKNIQDVLARGEALDHMQDRSRELLHKSKQFSWGAKQRNMMEAFKKWLPCVVFLLVILVVIYLRFG